MSVEQVTALIMAVVALITGLAGVSASRRGARETAAQQRAANRLSERVQAFDEIKEYADRLEREAQRARDEVNRVEETNDRRLAAQAQRCRVVLEELLASLTVLQGLVQGQISAELATEARARVHEHNRVDHPTTTVEEGNET